MTSTPIPRWGALRRPSSQVAHYRPAMMHVIPSLALGGAERIVLDLASEAARRGVITHVVIFHRHQHLHAFERNPNVVVHDLSKITRSCLSQAIVRRAHQAGITALYAHLINDALMEAIISAGCQVIPVVHNMKASWKADPKRWTTPDMPFVVACGEYVREELLESGCTPPVRTLRHLLGDVPHSDGLRETFRKHLVAEGHSQTCRVIGMVGRLVPQKNYLKAVRILAELRAGGMDVVLVIVGRKYGPENAETYAQITAEATHLGVERHLILLGALARGAVMLDCFDLFLNTSDFEGLSIATQEAALAGLPLILSDVGAQREWDYKQVSWLSPDADVVDWVEKIRSVMGDAERPLTEGVAFSTLKLPSVVNVMWQWSPVLGPGASFQPDTHVLFVTGNMNVGGAQRSLCNLSERLSLDKVLHTVAVMGSLGVPDFMDRAKAAGSIFLELQGPGGIARRIERILTAVQDTKSDVICFWNMDALTKMAVGKILAGGPVRVVDVSPGPMLFKELGADAHRGNLISTSPAAYLSALDGYVSKYEMELFDIEGQYAEALSSTPYAVIPNGCDLVPSEDNACPVHPPQQPGYDPALAAVTVGRLSIAKQPWLLPLVAKEMARIRPGSSLTVVGAIHLRDEGAWDKMHAFCPVMPDNLFFAGGNANVGAFLPRFAAFYMVSDDQGCPNASLEALACGLPVVANDSGGTNDQVITGRTGVLEFLHGTSGLEADFASCQHAARKLAQSLINVMTHRAEVDDAASLKGFVLQNFSIGLMAKRYAEFFTKIRKLNPPSRARASPTETSPPRPCASATSDLPVINIQETLSYV